MFVRRYQGVSESSILAGLYFHIDDNDDEDDDEDDEEDAGVRRIYQQSICIPIGKSSVGISSGF